MNISNVFSKKLDKESKDSSYSPDEMHSMIEKEAYSDAVARGFGGGHALDDWLIAERHVNEQVSQQAAI